MFSDVGVAGILFLCKLVNDEVYDDCEKFERLETDLRELIPRIGIFWGAEEDEEDELE